MAATFELLDLICLGFRDLVAINNRFPYFILEVGSTAILSCFSLPFFIMRDLFPCFELSISVFNQVCSMKSISDKNWEWVLWAASECRQTGSKQYTDEAHAWEVATVRVCLHVLSYIHSAMPVLLFTTIQRLDEFAVVGF